MEKPDFRTADHTIVLSDIHLSDAEPPDPKHPLWKRFKRPEHFVDTSFKNLLEHFDTKIEGTIELVLNGDIFDFDSVMALPEQPDFPVSWLERRRGLSAEEAKSRYKVKTILQDHPVLVDALRQFLNKGHRVVFVIGNHDVELHWATVQKEIVNLLDLPEAVRGNVRFADWFYISNSDTLIEHGNQYDAYCLCSNPLFPLIRKDSKRLVRLPFGNLAGKYMTNGMGLFNPHVESSYVMSVKGYLVFFFRYLIRTQPLLLWTWLWGATATLLISLREGLMPAFKDPLLVHRRVEEVAERSNATVRIVLSLRELHVHPAIHHPLMILRELWLDRAIFLIIIFFISFQIFSFLNVIVPVTGWWFWIPLALLLPVFVFYARSVNTSIYKVQRTALKRVPASARLAGVVRVVHGHTHREKHRVYKGIEVLNNGTWSPAFHDVECTRPYGRKCFTWIRPEGEASADPAETHVERVARLYEWRDPGMVRIPITVPE